MGVTQESSQSNKKVEKIYKNKKWLYEQYIINKLSTTAVAAMSYCSHETIGRWLVRFNIPIRSQSEAISGYKNPMFQKYGNSHPKYINIEKRFWDKVNKKGKDDCWEWTASCTEEGYGQISIKSETKLSHIFCWELFNKKSAKRGFHIHHKCENPKCCNPNHLQLLTISEHMIIHRSKNRII